MKAVMMNEYGDESVLQYTTDAARPEPQSDEILIKVRAAGFNQLDIKIRDGLGKMFDLQPPLILGVEIAGIVEQIGADVKNFKIGDEVFAAVSPMRRGGYAEYALVNESDAGIKPNNTDFETAAAIPVAALTSWQALFELAQLRRGQKVLIHGASGGVGSLAVQMAKNKGIYVYATASGTNEEFVTNLGADEFIDYKQEKFEEIVKDVDAVLDTIGGDTLERSFQTLKKGGFLVTTVQPPPEDKAQEFGVKAEMMLLHSSAEQLKEIAQMVEHGELKAFVETVLPLAEIKKAHEFAKNGHTRGKIVLRID